MVDVDGDAPTAVVAGRGRRRRRAAAMEIYGDDEMSEVKEAASCSDHGGIPSVGDAGGGGSDDLDQGPRPSIGCREKNRRCREEMQGRVVEDVVGCEDDGVDDGGRRRLKMAMRGDPIPVNCAVGDEVEEWWNWW